MRTWLLGAGVLGASFAASPATAQLAIDRLWVDFDAKSAQRADVIIRNESGDKYYITITPAEIVGPGTSEEQRLENSDPEKLGLLVTPNRLVLDPGALRSIRIVSLNTSVDTDRVYRVKIVPQVGAIDAPDPGDGNRGVAVKLLAAYDLLVTVRPRNEAAKLIAERATSGITIRNVGNTNTLLYEGEACPTNSGSEGEPACQSLGARRMYPGNVWKIALANPTARVSFKEKIGSNDEAKSVSF